jgi:hypothetical protein
MHRTTGKPTIIIIVDVVAASFIVITAAFTYHHKHHYWYPYHSSALSCPYFACSSWQINCIPQQIIRHGLINITWMMSIQLMH